MNRLYHGCIENMNCYSSVTKGNKGWGQSARIIPFIPGTGFVQCEVADEDLVVLLPGVDHDPTPAGVFIEDHLLLLCVPLEDPLYAGVMDWAFHNLTEETYLTAQVVVEICEASIITVVDSVKKPCWNKFQLETLKLKFTTITYAFCDFLTEIVKLFF